MSATILPYAIILTKADHRVTVSMMARVLPPRRFLFLLPIFQLFRACLSVYDEPEVFLPIYSGNTSCCSPPEGSKTLTQ